MSMPQNLTSPRKGEVGAKRREGVDRKFNRSPMMTVISRNLRRRMTDAELKLWRHLRKNQMAGHAFRRQHPIGRYVVDFWCPSLKLAIEVDGGQHGTAEGVLADQQRTATLEKTGACVLRFWNNEVLENIGGVLEAIFAKISELRRARSTPTPTLPLAGGGSSNNSPSKGEVGAERRAGFDPEIDR